MQVTILTPSLSPPVEGNHSTRGKLASFGRELTNCFDVSVKSDLSIKPTIIDVKCACPNDWAKEAIIMGCCYSQGNKAILSRVIETKL